MAAHSASDVLCEVSQHMMSAVQSLRCRKTGPRGAFERCNVHSHAYLLVKASGLGCPIHQPLRHNSVTKLILQA
jgi:hypothetical protein